jgi:Putative amidase domain
MRPLATQHTYDWNAAVWYAQTYASSPYSAYCNYHCCYGDCTNFVSQCYRQGGQVDQSPWLTNAGYCGQCDTAHCSGCSTSCPHTATYMGSDTWAGVDLANTFFTSTTNRATLKSSISQVSTGDYIDYNFGSGYAAGHKTIISQPNGTYTKVCSHSPFLKDYQWDSFGTVTANRFAWMNQYYDTP